MLRNNAPSFVNVDKYHLLRDSSQSQENTEVHDSFVKTCAICR